VRLEHWKQGSATSDPSSSEAVDIDEFVWPIHSPGPEVWHLVYPMRYHLVMTNIAMENHHF